MNVTGFFSQLKRPNIFIKSRRQDFAPVERKRFRTRLDECRFWAIVHEVKILPHMSGFFEEVQPRKVYRVAAAYIAAGFIIQIGSAVFPAWDQPGWAFRLVVVLLLMGFPIALV